MSKDEVKALSWFRTAAEAGDVNGMLSLGLMFQNGQGGLQRNESEALDWFRKAAKAGDSHVMITLGTMYLNGDLWFAKGRGPGSELVSCSR